MNKTNVIIFIIVALVSATSCNRAVNEDYELTFNNGPVFISAFLDSETKATLAESDGSFAFENTDIIKIWNGTAAVESVSVTPGEGTSATIVMPSGFDDKGDASNWFAGMPASSVTTISEGSITFTLPTMYTYTQVGGDKSCCPMIGTYSSGGSISFKQAGSVFRFRALGSSLEAGSITFTFLQKVTGKVTLSAVPEDKTTTSGIIESSLEEYGHSITVTISSEEYASIGEFAYFTLPVPSGTTINNGNNSVLVTFTPANGTHSSKIGAIAPATEATLVRAGGYKSSINLINVPELEFSVSGKNIVMAPGNLMANINTFDTTTGIATASEWRFEGPFEYVGSAQNAGNYLFANKSSLAIGQWVDFLTWQGTSVATEKRCQGLVSLSLDNEEYTGSVDNEDLYDTCWTTKAGGIIISNGGNYSTWRPFSIAEWVNLLDERSTFSLGGVSNARYTRATVAGVNGLMIFPDSDPSWNTETMGTIPVYINSKANITWGNQNNYSAANYVAQRAAGIAFLPALGYRNKTSVGTPGIDGNYWSSNGSANDFGYTKYAYYMGYYTGWVYSTNTLDRSYGFCVRLIREK